MILIGGFFHNIGHSDQLGSGVRNLYKYTKFYSGQEPELVEGDIFRIIVPLDDNYSFDQNIGRETDAKTNTKTDAKLTQKLTQTEQTILSVVADNPQVTLTQLAAQVGISVGGVRYSIRGLKEKEILSRTGSNRNGRWIIRQN